MLGAASERLLHVLGDHIEHLLGDPAESAKLAQITKVRQLKEWIVGHLPALRRKYPTHKDAFTDVADKLETLFTLYRYKRNEVGHPRETPHNPDVNQIRAMLLSFGGYAKAVADIMSTP